MHVDSYIKLNGYGIYIIILLVLYISRGKFTLHLKFKLLS